MLLEIFNPEFHWKAHGISCFWKQKNGALFKAGKQSQMLALVIICRAQHACGAGRRDAGQLSTTLGDQFLLERKETEHGGCFACTHKETAESNRCYFHLDSQHNSNFKRFFFSSFDAFPVTYSRNVQYLTKFSHLRNRKKILYYSILEPVLNNLRIVFFVHINN